MKPETRSSYEIAIERALACVLEDLDQRLALDTLAREAALSPFHFHRIFRGMVGETPLQLQRRLRMERAAWSLLVGEQSVIDVALNAGYETHESFTRAFRAHYGCSPTELRQRRGEQVPLCVSWVGVELAAPSGIHFRDGRLWVPPWRFSARGVEHMQVEICELDEIRLATRAHIGAYDKIHVAFEQLGQLAAQAGLFGPSAAMIALYYDDPEATPTDELRADAALSVAQSMTLPEGLVERHIEAGLYACTTHVGDYAKLGESWAAFMGQWLPQSGYQLGEGVSFERYENSPREVAPHELLTTLYVPLMR